MKNKKRAHFQKNGCVISPYFPKQNKMGLQISKHLKLPSKYFPFIFLKTFQANHVEISFNESLLLNDPPKCWDSQTPKQASEVLPRFKRVINTKMDDGRAVMGVTSSFVEFFPLTQPKDQKIEVYTLFLPTERVVSKNSKVSHWLSFEPFVSTVKA